MIRSHILGIGAALIRTLNSLLSIVQSLEYRRRVKDSMKQTNTTLKSPLVTSLDTLFQFWAWILLAWSVYRYFLHLPEWADELIFKPLVFVLPVLLYVSRREKRNWESIGITSKNIFNSIYIGIGFGFLFALEGLLVNWLNNGTLLIHPIQALRDYGMVPLLGLSIATAFCEELLSRGFLFNRIWEITKNLVYAVFISSILFVLLHVPILVTTLKFEGSTLALFFLTNLLLGIINCILYAKTRSLVAPVLVHIFWNMTVALFL